MFYYGHKEALANIDRLLKTKNAKGFNIANASVINLLPDHPPPSHRAGSLPLPNAGPACGSSNVNPPRSASIHPPGTTLNPTSGLPRDHTPGAYPTPGLDAYGRTSTPNVSMGLGAPQSDYSVYLNGRDLRSGVSTNKSTSQTKPKPNPPSADVDANAIASAYGTIDTGPVKSKEYPALMLQQILAHLGGAQAFEVDDESAATGSKQAASKEASQAQATTGTGRRGVTSRSAASKSATPAAQAWKLNDTSAASGLKSSARKGSSQVQATTGTGKRAISSRPSKSKAKPKSTTGTASVGVSSRSATPKPGTGAARAGSAVGDGSSVPSKSKAKPTTATALSTSGYPPVMTDNGVAFTRVQTGNDWAYVSTSPAPIPDARGVATGNAGGANAKVPQHSRSSMDLESVPANVNEDSDYDEDDNDEDDADAASNESDGPPAKKRKPRSTSTAAA